MLTDEKKKELDLMKRCTLESRGWTEADEKEWRRTCPGLAKEADEKWAKHNGQKEEVIRVRVVNKDPAVKAASGALRKSAAVRVTMPFKGYMVRGCLSTTCMEEAMELMGERGYEVLGGCREEAVLDAEKRGRRMHKWGPVVEEIDYTR